MKEMGLGEEELGTVHKGSWRGRGGREGSGAGQGRGQQRKVRREPEPSAGLSLLLENRKVGEAVRPLTEPPAKTPQLKQPVKMADPTSVEVTAISSQEI